jgi:hypothetical protein
VWVYSSLLDYAAAPIVHPGVSQISFNEKIALALTLNCVVLLTSGMPPRVESLA